MKHIFTITILLFIVTSVSGQLNEEWLNSDSPLVAITHTHFRQIGENILMKSEMSEGGSHEQAMSISENGTLNWFDAYTNFQECSNCGLQGLSDVAISSVGDMYSVGFQPASPFGGAYFSKQNVNGEYEFNNEYFSGSMFKEFYFLDLSEDEQHIFIVGENLENNDGYQMIYKMNTDGTLGNSTPSATYFPSTLDVNGNNIYVSQTDFEQLFIENYNENLELQWTYNLSLPNYGITSLQAQKLPNGDMLYAALGENNNSGFRDIILIHLHPDGTAEHTEIQTVFDSSFIVFLEDLYFNGTDQFGVTYLARGNGNINEPQGIQGGKGGPTNYYLKLDLFEIDFSPIYSNLIEPFNGNYLNALNLSKVRIDSNGNALLCYGETYNTPELGNEKNLVVILFDASGQEVDRYTAPAIGLQYPFGSFLPQEGSLYVQGTYGVDGASSTWGVIKFAYSIESGIDESNLNSLNAYPNPFHDEIRLDFKQHSNVIELYDISGRLIKVYKTSSNSETIDTSELSSGIYILKLLNSQESVRVIKY